MSTRTLFALACFVLWLNVGAAVNRFAEHSNDMMIGVLIGLSLQFATGVLARRFILRGEQERAARELADAIEAEMSKRGYNGTVLAVGLIDDDGRIHELERRGQSNTPRPPDHTNDKADPNT